MEFLGLLFEFIFLAIGVYMYLFAIGKLQSKDSALQQKAEKFRKENAGWMRIMGLALAAIMTVNIFLHLMQWG